MPKPRKSLDIRNGPRQRKTANRIRASSLNENDTIDVYGWGSLFKAVSRNNIDAIFEILKEPGTNVNRAFTHGWTPLMIAVQKCNITVTELLLEHNANVDCQNNAGLSALHEAARKDHPRLVTKLLDWRANPLVLDRFGRPPRSKYNDEVNTILRKAKFRWRINHIWGARQVTHIRELQHEILKYLN